MEGKENWLMDVLNALKFFRVAAFNRIFAFSCIRRPKLPTLLYFLRFRIFHWEFSCQIFQYSIGESSEKYPKPTKKEQCW